MIIIADCKNLDYDEYNYYLNSISNNHIYAESWYLDTVTNHKWSAIIVYNKSGKITNALPFAHNKKLGFKYVYQHYFTQQLGLISTETDPENIIISECLSLLAKHFNYIDYAFNVYNHISIKKEFFSLSESITHHLHLNKAYPLLENCYSNNHKRNLKKAKGLLVAESNDINPVIDLFKKGKGKNINVFTNNHYNTLKEIFKEALLRGCCKLLVAVNRNNEIMAGALFLIYKQKITFLFGASSEQGKQNGAMTLLMDTLIKEHAEKDYTLDFEGSNVEGIARFYKGFGAEAVKFKVLHYNNLPWPIKLLKRSS